MILTILSLSLTFPAVFAGPAAGSHPSPVDNSTPPSNSVPPPVTGLTPPPKSHGSSGGVEDSRQCSKKIQPDSTVQLENEPNLNSVQAPLLCALTACRQTVKVIIWKTLYDGAK